MNLKLVFVLQDIMNGYREFTGLSPQSGAILDHLSSPSKLQTPLFSMLSSGNASPGLSVETSISSTKSSIDITVEDKIVAADKPQASCSLLFLYFLKVSLLLHHCNRCGFICLLLQDLDNEAADGSPEEDDSVVSSPTSPPSISLLSPKAMEMAGCIIKFEQNQRQKAQVRYSYFTIWFTPFFL